MSADREAIRAKAGTREAPLRIANLPRVVYQEGVPHSYVIWYIEAFPLSALKYTPLEDVDGETPRRLELAADINAHGLVNPLLVHSHTPRTQRPMPRPYFLAMGYNKLWSLRYLGRTHASAFLTLDAGQAPEFPCRACYRNDDLLRFFGDGDLVVGFDGLAYKNVTSIVNWQLPVENRTRTAWGRK